MTNEEAREQLKDIARSFSREYFHDWREALDVAIKALEQHLCEDCISRDSLNDAISELTYWHFEDGRLVVGGGGIKSETVYKVDDVTRMPDILPSVTPKSEDIKEAYLKGYDYGVKDWFKSKTQPCEDAVSKQIRDCENCKHHTENGCSSWNCQFESKEGETG